MHKELANSLPLLLASDTCLLIGIHASSNKKEIMDNSPFRGPVLECAVGLKAWLDPLHCLGAMDC